MSEYKNFELLAHTADLKIRVYGSSIQELFKNSLIGMFQSIGPHAYGCVQKNGRLICPSLPKKRKLSVQATSVDDLLIDFLSDALYLSDVHNEAYLDLILHHFDTGSLDVELLGVEIERFDVVEIKAVTYHGSRITKTPDGWMVDIIFDI